MEEKERRALIKHYFKKVKSSPGITEEIGKMRGNWIYAHSIGTVYEWHYNFWSGHMGTSEAHRSERLAKVTPL